MMPKSTFVVHPLSLDENWRSIVLMGVNTASYKFALAKAVLELAKGGKDRVRLPNWPSHSRSISAPTSLRRRDRPSARRSAAFSKPVASITRVRRTAPRIPS